MWNRHLVPTFKIEMKAKDFFKLFGALLVTHLGVIYVNEHEVLMLITKYSLVGSLIGWYVSWPERPKIKDPFLWALVFCLSGDILLSFGQEESFFLAGLASFFFAHLLYIRRFANKSIRQPAPAWRIAGLAVFSIGLMIAVLKLFLPGAQGLETPLIFYGIAILLMWNSTNFIAGHAGSWPIFLGATLFVLSDLLLGYNRFYQALENANLWIMATYGAGQGLLVFGMYRIDYGSTS